MEGRIRDGSNSVVKKTQELRVFWSDGYGAYRYVLNHYHEYENGERTIVNDAQGDAKWAKDVAKHYDIKVPKVQDEEK